MDSAHPPISSRRRFLGACASCLAFGSLAVFGQPRVPDRRMPKKTAINPWPARYAKNLDPETTQCLLCPNVCIRRPGETGKCRARANIGGTYRTLVYNNPCLVHLDKMEKMPMYHFLPGANVFSVATAGCNLTCKYCQNWQFSQRSPYETENIRLSPSEAVKKAGDAGCKAVSFFYTEPVVYFEYMADIASLAKKSGFKTVMVTAGYINPEPLAEILPLIDAVTFGLKGFSESFYGDVVGGDMDHVKNALLQVERSGVWTELVTLLVPTLNDDPDDIRRLCEWVGSRLSKNRPIHFTRFVPEYLLRNLPITPQRTLETARDIARESGLSYVYTGNLPGHEGNNTCCPTCGTLLVRRIGTQVKNILLKNGRCPSCKTIQPGPWTGS